MLKMKLQESLLSITRESPLSPGVISFLQDESIEHRKPLGGIFSDAQFGWLAVGPRLCVVDLKNGQKVAAWTFGASLSLNTWITSACELPTPLCDNTRQLIVSLACEDIGGLVVVFHCNGSQVLRCIQTKTAATELSVVERTDGPLECCDTVVVAGTELGEIILFDLNRASLVQALKNSSQGYDHLIRNEQNMTNLAFLSLDDVALIEEQREIAVETDDHLAFNLNDQSFIEGEYILRNPDGSVRMKAKRGHVIVTKLLYIPQLGSVVVGYNFGGFQIWNLMHMCLEYTSAVNVECLPVTHFGFQEPCDDPRAFCYLWAVYSTTDRAQDEACPLAVMYSLTYQGKRIPGVTQCIYQDFTSCTKRFELDLSSSEGQVAGGRSLACHTYSILSTLHGEGDEGVVNLCQLLWESWSDSPNSPVIYKMLLFDLDQWYKGQMPERWCLQNSTFMSVTTLESACAPIDSRMLVSTLAPYTHVQRLEEHFYPNSLKYSIICLSTDQVSQLSTLGVQRQLIYGMNEVGPTVLLHPTQLYRQCVTAGLTPIYSDVHLTDPDVTEQRKYLLSVGLEGRLSSFLNKCACDWARGSHTTAGCTLQLFVDWCWSRAMVLKRNAGELCAKHTSGPPDRNVFRCLEHCVRQLTLIVGLLDSVVTKCCNIIVPDALSDMEDRCKAIGTVTTYFRMVHWFLSVGLLPECSMEQELHILHNGEERLPYPSQELMQQVHKRRIKLSCLDGRSMNGDEAGTKSCSLLYIDQLIEHECGGEIVYKLWRSDMNPSGMYPPPSLNALLNVCLLADVPTQHKHSLVLYLLLDLSDMFVDARYEGILRKLMQFPTMFGLSNAAIKATQAFWHLDHRNFDFALDQLQCLTGNTLAEWQHSVVLSALLAQKKTQAALQYLHVRKPPPVQAKSCQSPDVRRDDKLEEWQSCCELYLSRELVFEAIEVVRLAVQNAGSFAEKLDILQCFFRGCKKTGQLSKVLNIPLTRLEEEIFIKYLQNGDRQCGDLLVMFYMQQARYLEGRNFNSKLKQLIRQKESIYNSIESCAETGFDRDFTRDNLVEMMCEGLPNITDKVQSSFDQLLSTPKVITAKPMSVFVQARSPKDFVYKSSFIKNSIENASETWIRKPKLARGLKRALEIEETPFICTPKLSRTRSVYESGLDEQSAESTPAKRARRDIAPPPLTPRTSRLGSDIQAMLDMPENDKVPDWKIQSLRSERSMREATPQSILKVRRTMDRDQPSPVDSRYLADTDEEMETASRHSNFTHTSDKHLRFDIPSSSNSSSPGVQPSLQDNPELQRQSAQIDQSNTEPSPGLMGPVNELTDHTDGGLEGISRLSDSGRYWSESPKDVQRKLFKDNVKARLSHSISANSSLNNDAHASIESISDIPVMIINPRYSGEQKLSRSREQLITPSPDRIMVPEAAAERNVSEERDDVTSSRSSLTSTPITPRGRPSIRCRSVADSPQVNLKRSNSRTPENRMDSPMPTVLSSPRPQRLRSRSKTPETKGKSPKESSNLEPIQEQPKLEYAEDNSFSSQRILRTPEKSVTDTSIVVKSKLSVSKQLDTAVMSPGKDSEDTGSSPLRRSLRSRSRTPEVETPKPTNAPKTPRGKSKTPDRERPVSPKLASISKSAKKKPLSRLVLEAKIEAKINKTKTVIEESASSPPGSSKLGEEEFENVSVLQDSCDSIIECTPMKDKSSARPIEEYEFSPIDNMSVLRSLETSVLPTTPQSDVSITDLTPIKTVTPLSYTFVDKSVLQDYKSSSDQSKSNSPIEFDIVKPQASAFEYSSSPVDPLCNESVLKDVSTTPIKSIDSSAMTDDLDEPSTIRNEVETADIREEKQMIVEIVQEITEIEEQIEGLDESNTSASSEVVSSVGNETGDNEDDTSDSGNDSDSDDRTCDSSEESPIEEANIGIIGSQVISLDSSDDENGSPPKKVRMTPPNLDRAEQCLEIERKEVEELQNLNESEDTDNELEKNIDSNLDTSMSESVKDGNVMIDKDKDPFLKKLEKDSDTDINLKLDSEDNREESIVMDVLNECNYSLMTDDNSVIATDRSELDTSMPEILEEKETERNKEQDRIEPMDTQCENLQSSKNFEKSHLSEENRDSDKPDETIKTQNEPASNIDYLSVAFASDSKNCEPAQSVEATKDKKVEGISNEQIDIRSTSEVIVTIKHKTSKLISSNTSDTQQTSAKSEVSKKEKSSSCETVEASITSDDGTKIGSRNRSSSSTSTKSEKNEELKESTQSKFETIGDSLTTNDKKVEAISESQIDAPKTADEIESLTHTTRKSSSSITSTTLEKSEKSEISKEPQSSTHGTVEGSISSDDGKKFVTRKRSSSNASRKSEKVEDLKELTPSESKTIADSLTIDVTDGKDTIFAKSTSSNTSKKSEKVKELNQISTMPELMDTSLPLDDVDGKATTIRKRTASTSSNTSKKGEQMEETKETARVLKRRTSAKSNISEDLSLKTPTRRRHSNESETDQIPDQKDVTPPQLQKIIKRRTSSKSTKSEVALQNLVDENPDNTSNRSKRRTSSKSSDEILNVQITPEKPLRRSTRRGSKKTDDDNISVQSVDSTPSKDSKVESDSIKSGSARKSRKSLGVSSKPDLSVIPEIEDSAVSKLEDNSQMMQEYSSTRRLTRHQRSLLERSLEQPRTIGRPPRRISIGSAASVASVAGSETSVDNESVRSDPFGVQPIDPITLLNKRDFEGPPDKEELYAITEEFQDSPDVATARSLRIKGASETGSIKDLKLSRRLSSDIDRALSPAASLDTSLTGSPGRPRRTSFNKALDAISTPKRGRRSSVDVEEGDTDSLPGSPRQHGSKGSEASVTPQRRSRRKSSVNSDVTEHKSPARRNLRSTSVAESTEEQDQSSKK